MRIPDRYEFKYLVPERLVPAMRTAIAPFCAPDRFSATAPDLQYAIVSLYLDTPDRAFHRAKAERPLRRLKLRVRTYGDAADGPVFFEVKRKVGNVVSKARARVPRENWSARLTGSPPADASPAERDFFSVLVSRGAQPTLLARYRREAYYSTVDAYARVTFDRRLQYQACPSHDLRGDPRAWSAEDDVLATRGIAGAVVLELKATLAVPTWMEGLVRRFDLLRVGFSKYCTGVERIWGSQDLSGGGERAAVFGADGWRAGV